MMKTARVKTPQTKRQLSSRELLEHLVTYRAERQFVWAFLRKEFGLERNGMRWLRNTDAKHLAEAHHYLHLTPHQIVEGLSYSHQDDKDAAEELEISERSIRSLLSKFLR